MAEIKSDGAAKADLNPAQVRGSFKLLTAISAPATSGHADVSKMKNTSIQTRGTFTGLSMDIEGSNDDTNFSKIGASITGEGITQVPMYVRQLRVDLTAITTGTVDVQAAGIS